jgi:cysteine desulfuration protein SufE
MRFEADADALIPKGIVQILIRCFNNQTPSDILRADIRFIDTIGLSQNLSPSRANGIHSMYQKIRQYAEQTLNYEIR